MKVRLVNRDGSEVDLTEHVRPLEFRIERRFVLTRDVQRELDAVPNDPHLQEYMRAAIKLTTLRMSASIFGASEAWVQSQLTDRERAALATTAEPVERLQLPAPEVGEQVCDRCPRYTGKPSPRGAGCPGVETCVKIAAAHKEPIKLVPPKADQ